MSEKIEELVRLVRKEGSQMRKEVDEKFWELHSLAISKGDPRELYWVGYVEGRLVDLVRTIEEVGCDLDNARKIMKDLETERR